MTAPSFSSASPAGDSKQTKASPLTCDGCGRTATAEHIAGRLQRLEWATRFRPLHIQVLFVAKAPIGQIENDFYAVPDDADSMNSSSDAGSAFDFLLDAFCAVPISADLAKPKDPAAEQGRNPETTGRAAQLAEFQKAGMYLAFLIECPWESSGIASQGTQKEFENLSTDLETDSAGPTSRFAGTLLKRIRFSYRPKHIVLISAATRRLIPVLTQANLGSALLLDNGAPFELPRRGDAAGARRLRGILQSVDQRVIG